MRLLYIVTKGMADPTLAICKPLQRSATTDHALLMSRSDIRVRLLDLLQPYCNRARTEPDGAGKQRRRKPRKSFR